MIDRYKQLISRPELEHWLKCANDSDECTDPVCRIGRFIADELIALIRPTPLHLYLEICRMYVHLDAWGVEL